LWRGQNGSGKSITTQSFIPLGEREKRDKLELLRERMDWEPERPESWIQSREILNKEGIVLYGILSSWMLGVVYWIAALIIHKIEMTHFCAKSRIRLFVIFF
jgi:hypothetical protein